MAEDRQRIHMKYQDLFSLINDERLSSAAVMFGALRANSLTSDSGQLPL